MKIKRILELIAPSTLLNFRGEAQIETITGDIVTCRCCNGSKGKYIDSRCVDYDPDVGEHFKPCQMCKGSGMVKPIISVEWKAEGPI